MNQRSRTSKIRHLLPVGRTKLVTFRGDSGRDVTISVDVLEHSTDAVYLGDSVSMLCMPYDRIVGVGCVVFK